MAVALSLECKTREIKSAGYLKQLKREGGIPAVIYGKEWGSTPIIFSSREFGQLIKHKGSQGIFSLKLEGQEAPVMALIREIQKHPVKGNVLHVDFLAVKMDEKITSTIAVRFTGEEEITAKGNVLQILSTAIGISCLPGDIPDAIVYDVSGLEVGDKVTVGDLDLSEEIEIIEDPATVLANVLMPGRSHEDEEETENAPEEAEETAETTESAE